MSSNKMEVHQKNAEPWRVTLVDTGDDTQTGGRLKRVSEYVKYEEAFCFTYGDGLSDVDVSALISFHKEHGKLATVTAVQPPGRFGALERDGFSCYWFY
jgi:glucose-1-phosphate cytidylyltransferase